MQTNELNVSTVKINTISASLQWKRRNINDNV